MLPSIHPSASAQQPPQPFTLSDCSEVSLLSRDDSNNHFLLHQQYQLPPCSISTHSSTVSPQFQLTQSSALQQPCSVSMPATASSPAQNVSAVSRVKIAKTPNKIARARTRLPPKTDGSITYRPSTTKKVRSSKSNIPGESRYWTPSEHKLFVEALLKYGPKDLKSISAYVGTRNMIQCRTHEQKCFMRLMREAQRETFQRNGEEFDDPEERRKLQKDVYSVPPSCGITLLCVVGEEMSRSLQS